MDKRRHELLEGIVVNLYWIIDLLSDSNGGCSFECASALLGALIKNMKSNGLYPRSYKPLSGYSVTEILAAVEGFRTPDWSCFSKKTASARHRLNPPCDCTISEYTSTMAIRIDVEMKAFCLSEFFPNLNVEHKDDMEHEPVDSTS